MPITANFVGPTGAQLENASLGGLLGGIDGLQAQQNVRQARNDVGKKQVWDRIMLLADKQGVTADQLHAQAAMWMKDYGGMSAEDETTFSNMLSGVDQQVNNAKALDYAGAFRNRDTGALANRIAEAPAQTVSLTGGGGITDVKQTPPPTPQSVVAPPRTGNPTFKPVISDLTGGGLNNWLVQDERGVPISGGKGLQSFNSQSDAQNKANQMNTGYQWYAPNSNTKKPISARDAQIKGFVDAGMTLEDATQAVDLKGSVHTPHPFIKAPVGLVIPVEQPELVEQQAAAVMDAKGKYERMYNTFLNNDYTPTLAEKHNLNLLRQNYQKLAVANGQPDPFPSVNKAGGSGQPQLTPSQLSEWERKSGDVHSPALVGKDESILNARAGKALPDLAKAIEQANSRFPVTPSVVKNYAGGKGKDSADEVSANEATLADQRARAYALMQEQDNARQQAVNQAYQQGVDRINAQAQEKERGSWRAGEDETTRMMDQRSAMEAQYAAQAPLDTSGYTGGADPNWKPPSKQSKYSPDNYDKPQMFRESKEFADAQNYADQVKAKTKAWDAAKLEMEKIPDPKYWSPQTQQIAAQLQEDAAQKQRQDQAMRESQLQQYAQAEQARAEQAFKAQAFMRQAGFTPRNSQPLDAQTHGELASLPSNAPVGGQTGMPWSQGTSPIAQPVNPPMPPSVVTERVNDASPTFRPFDPSGRSGQAGMADVGQTPRSSELGSLDSARPKLGPTRVAGNLNTPTEGVSNPKQVGEIVPSLLNVPTDSLTPQLKAKQLGEVKSAIDQGVGEIRKSRFQYSINEDSPYAKGAGRESLMRSRDIMQRLQDAIPNENYSDELFNQVRMLPINAQRKAAADIKEVGARTRYSDAYADYLLAQADKMKEKAIAQKPDLKAALQAVENSPVFKDYWAQLTAIDSKLDPTARQKRANEIFTIAAKHPLFKSQWDFYNEIWSAMNGDPMKLQKIKTDPKYFLFFQIKPAEETTWTGPNGSMPAAPLGAASNVSAASSELSKSFQ